MAEENLINFEMADEMQDATVFCTETSSGGSFVFAGLIPTFLDEPTQHISDFFDMIDEIAALASWMDGQRSGIAKCKLAGVAREYAWRDFQAKDVTDYQAFKVLMLQRFVKAPYTTLDLNSSTHVRNSEERTCKHLPLGCSLSQPRRQLM